MENGLLDHLQIYLKNWKWFLLCLVLGLLAAFVFIRYATPKYLAKGKIQIVEDANSGTGLELFSELDLLGGGQSNVEDEIEIIASRSNFIEVVTRLGLNTTVYSLGNIKKTELYNNPPVKINLLGADSIVTKSRFVIFLDLKSESNFDYSIETDEAFKSYAYGKPIPTAIGNILITPNAEVIKRYLNQRIQIVINPIDDVAENYRLQTRLGTVADKSSILNISLESAIKEKASDVINTLIDIYNENAIADKQEIADKTSTFINDRIANISSSLSNVDQSAQDFKTGRGVTDIASEANINLNIGAANRQELANVETQLNIASGLKELVDGQEGYEVLPSNIGLADPTIASTTAEYNQLVQERKRLLQTANEKNPVVVNIDQQLSGLKQTLQSSVSSMTNNLGLQVNTLSRQQSIINSKIYSAPKNERALRDITRQQQTTEQLYLYLLEKREESQIAVASTAPKSRIVDRAYYGKIPVSPKKNIIYLAFGLIGMLIPFGLIFVKTLFDNKIHNMTSLEKIAANTPILGELPRLGKKDSKMVLKDDRSVLAEAVRIIRTNLDYLINTKQKSGTAKNNIIFVTSSVPGEGKTFLSVNLSMILANNKKKVLLIGGDVRNPKFKSFFKDKKVNRGGENGKTPTKNIGLTDYLHNESVELKHIVSPIMVQENDLDIIYSGRIPPNPTELLMSDRFKDLFAAVSAYYDYVIVDTAPLMLVSDTLLISQYADFTIYVTRAETTETKAVDFPIKLQEEGKINGLSFIVNDVNIDNLGYGGKYGYGYGKSMKKWWKF